MTALGRNGGRMPLCDLTRRGVFRRTWGDDIDGLIHAGGERARVWVVASEKFQIASAGVDYGLRVGSPANLPHVLPVVPRVSSHADAFEIGGCGNPDVAGAAFIQDPGDLIAGGSGNQFRGKGRREDCSRVKFFAPNTQTNAGLANRMLRMRCSLHPEIGFQKIVHFLRILYDSGTTLAWVKASDEMEGRIYESND